MAVRRVGRAEEGDWVEGARCFLIGASSFHHKTTLSVSSIHSTNTYSEEYNHYDGAHNITKRAHLTSSTPPSATLVTAYRLFAENESIVSSNNSGSFTAAAAAAVCGGGAVAELPADETTLEVAVEATSAAPDGGISTGFKGGRETIVPPVCRLLLPGAFVMMKTVALDEATIDGGFEFERQKASSVKDVHPKKSLDCIPKIDCMNWFG
eukprot:scaffold2031_cov185-Alexandrium_tamarense.AAC.13